MFLEQGGRPNDQRGFVHKSFIGRAIGGVAKKFITSTPIGGVVSTALSIIKPPARRTVPRSLTARTTEVSSNEKQLGRALKFPELATGATSQVDFRVPQFAPTGIPVNGASPCRTNESPKCCRLRNGTFQEQRRWQRECGVAGNGQAPGPTQLGEAVMGRYGAAVQPGVMMIERSVCDKGMTLGNDGLCYNKGSITNKQRQWPRGRRPLLTGGDMRAIGVAARAGAKLDRTTKRLRTLGMMKKLPAPRKAPAHQHAKPVAAVSVS